MFFIKAKQVAVFLSTIALFCMNTDEYMIVFNLQHLPIQQQEAQSSGTILLSNILFSKHDDDSNHADSRSMFSTQSKRTMFDLVFFLNLTYFTENIKNNLIFLVLQ